MAKRIAIDRAINRIAIAMEIGFLIIRVDMARVSTSARVVVIML